MRRTGRRAGGGAVLAALLLVAGCGGQPTVTPAGSAGLEVPYDDGDATTPNSPGPTPAAPAVPGTGKPPPVIPLPGSVSTFAPPSPATQPRTGAGAGTGAGTGKTKPPGVNVPAPAVLTLPALGSYDYDLTGKSTLGTPPKSLRLTVSAAAGGAEQLWTLDARGNDGSGLIEELTVSRQEDGVYLSAYRLDAATGIAGIILEFAPPSPVLLEPVKTKPGQTWKFDLESKDGCAAAHTEGVLISEGKAGTGTGSMRHVRLTTTLKTIGPPTCPAVSGKRVQDTYHPVATLLPSRLDSDLAGSLTGVPVKSSTKATRSAAVPETLARRSAGG